MRYLAFLALLVTVSRTYSEHIRMCNARFCRCVKDAGTFVRASCKLDKIEDLKTYIQTPSRVTVLVLSSNHIDYLPKQIFTGFDNLISLSLANNDITVIGNQSLTGLTSLKYLNLTNNKISHWYGDITAHAPALQVIDVTGSDWLPSNNILTHQRVQTINGVTWSKSCTQCTLVRNKSHHGNEVQEFKEGEYLHGSEGECRAMKYVVSSQLQILSRYGYYSSCFESDTVCYSTLVESIPIHRCWDTDNHILNVEFIIGPIAFILNIIVILNTLTTPKLRQNVAMMLVCNIALSDLLISLYSILITSLRKMTYVKFYSVMDSICPCLGFLWVIAQTVTVITLVFLTIERYLAIVYCMTPTIRMRKKHAIYCVICSWLVAFTVAILPVSGIGVYTSNTYCLPLNRKKDIPHMYGYSVGIVVCAIVLYLVTIPLYIRIHRFVKNNSLEGFNRADGSVARKIAVMVGCNLFFFCFPLFIAFLWVSFHVTKGLDPIVKEIITGVIPIITFTVNCLINPLLYAYRNKSFVNALKDRLKLLRTKARAWSLSNNPPSPQRTCTEEVNIVNNVR